MICFSVIICNFFVEKKNLPKEWNINDESDVGYAHNADDITLSLYSKQLDNHEELSKVTPLNIVG